MRERIQAAYTAINNLCYEVSGGDLSIPAEDKEVLDKYLASGYIKLNSKKIGKQKDIYFPSLGLEELTGLSGSIWLRILRHSMSNNGISSGIGPNSIREYVGKPWEYDIDPMVVEKDHKVGSNQLDEEAAAWKEILKEEEND